MKKVGIFFLSVAVLFSIYSPAKAYVLQGQHLLELMTRNFKKTKRLLVSQQLILYDNGGSKSAVELNETLRYDFPETFRSDISSENVKRIYVLSKGTALTVIDGKAAIEPETRYDRYKDIMLYNSRALLEQRLSGHGVDFTVSSVGRFQDQPAYVIGAQYPDETVPQIWLDKDTFRPIRWIITGKAADNPEDFLEVRYLDWQQVHRAWYPMRVEFYKNGILVRLINVDHIEAAPHFSEDLFNISHLKSIYRLDTAAVPDASDEKELNEVQKTIEKFKKMYE